MTTLAADVIREHSLGDIGEYPVIANDIIYQGAAVGLVDATGHARPLTNADRFVGFATSQVNNTGGAAAALNVRTTLRGEVQLAVTGAVITDVGQAVYAQDDNAFSFNPVDGVFIGFVTRYVSTGVVIVEYGPELQDPWGDYAVRETVAGTNTVDATDCGRLFCLTEAADADVQTLPAVAVGASGFAILYVGAFGGALVAIDVDNSDMILGPNITGSDGKQLRLTKATARRGDFVKISNSDADGYHVSASRGTWVRE